SECQLSRALQHPLAGQDSTLEASLRGLCTTNVLVPRARSLKETESSPLDPNSSGRIQLPDELQSSKLDIGLHASTRESLVWHGNELVHEPGDTLGRDALSSHALLGSNPSSCLDLP